MIIRHAEKHQHGLGHGVDLSGHSARHELTVQGWQRAGALVQFFSAPRPHSPIATPRSIFASDATRESPSLRAMHTAGPLAEALGVTVNHDFAEGEEDRLAEAVRNAPSPALIVWHHGCIVPLTQQIAGHAIDCPKSWPDERFDMVWILERKDLHAPWHFSQFAQCLLAGDRPEVIT
ncbi:MAG: histidine phosphatase family protein [Alphaproteobacteria bacterium]|nr:histidine phosphatase family protein [Alphaproteobacteria bacterium]